MKLKSKLSMLTLAVIFSLIAWEKKIKDEYYFNKFIETIPKLAQAKADAIENRGEETAKKLSKLENEIKQYGKKTRKIGPFGLDGANESLQDTLESKGIISAPPFYCVGVPEKTYEIRIGNDSLKVIEFREKIGDCEKGYFTAKRAYLNLDAIEGCRDPNACKIEALLHETYHSLLFPTVIRGSEWKGKVIDLNRIPLPEERELGAYLFTFINAGSKSVSDAALRTILCVLNHSKKSEEETDSHGLASSMIVEELRKKGIGIDDFSNMDYKKRAVVAEEIFRDLGYSKHIRDDIVYVFAKKNFTLKKKYVWVPEKGFYLQ